jgi:hypothetical protein
MILVCHKLVIASETVKTKVKALRTEELDKTQKHRGLAISRDRSLQPRILVRIHLNLGKYYFYSMLQIAISQARLNSREIPWFCPLGKTSLECHTLYGFKMLRYEYEEGKFRIEKQSENRRLARGETFLLHYQVMK